MLSPRGAQISTRPMAGAKLTIFQLGSEGEIWVPGTSTVKVPMTEQSQDFLLNYKTNREKGGKNFT